MCPKNDFTPPSGFLASELFLIIVKLLETERDINSLFQTNRRLYALLNPYLYRSNSQNSSSALVWAGCQTREGSHRSNINTGRGRSYSDGRSGRTPLSWAAEYGHEAVVQLLLGTTQVDVDSKDSSGQTPLYWAAARGDEAVVQRLLFSLS